MTLIKYLSPTVLLISIWTLPISAADIKAGEQKAAMCFGCHGQGGNSSNAQWPSLAGQQTTYIINQLKAFKNGDRKNPMMQSMAANLSNDDIAMVIPHQMNARRRCGIGPIRQREGRHVFWLPWHIG